MVKNIFFVPPVTKTVQCRWCGEWTYASTLFFFADGLMLFRIPCNSIWTTVAHHASLEINGETAAGSRDSFSLCVHVMRISFCLPWHTVVLLRHFLQAASKHDGRCCVREDTTPKTLHSHALLPVGYRKPLLLFGSIDLAALPGNSREVLDAANTAIARPLAGFPSCTCSKPTAFRSLLEHLLYQFRVSEPLSAEHLTNKRERRFVNTSSNPQSLSLLFVQRLCSFTKTRCLIRCRYSAYLATQSVGLSRMLFHSALLQTVHGRT